MSVYNFHEAPVTFDVSVAQADDTVYEQTVSLEGVAEGEYASSKDSVELPEIAATRVSGGLPDRELTTSTTVPYDELPSGFGFYFDRDDDGELGLWSIH